MTKTATNEQGEEIIVDSGTAPEDQAAEHPDGPPPKADDQVSGAVAGDAEINDPPVRTNLPDEPIIQRLGTGAGEHTPVTDKRWDGRRMAEPSEDSGKESDGASARRDAKASGDAKASHRR